MSNESSLSWGQKARSLFSLPDIIPPETNSPTFEEVLRLEDDVYGKVQAFSPSDVILNRYEVLDLHHGALGDVYHCLDRRYSVPVALKTLIADELGNRTAYSLFYQETERCVRLQRYNHENVIRIYRIEMVNGYPYIVSEWIDGISGVGNSLHDWLQKSSSFSVNQVFECLYQIVLGLIHCEKFLSTDGVPFVHGDIKPDNILITAEHVFKISDFSVNAHTFEYEAPEMSSGEPLGEWSDIYSLGLTVKKMFDKVAHPDAGTESSTAYSALKDIICKCIQKDSRQRFQSFQSLLGEVQKIYALHEEQAVKDNRPTLTEKAAEIYSQIEFGQYSGKGINVTSMGNVRYNLNEYIRYTSPQEAAERKYYEGVLARQHGDYEGSLKLLNEAGRSSGGYTGRILSAIGTTYMWMGDNYNATRYFDAAIERDHSFEAMEGEVNIFFLYSQQFLSSEKISERKDYLLNRLNEGKWENKLFVLLGSYCQISGDYINASFYYRESLKYANSNEWMTIYRYGLCEYLQQDVSTAYEIFHVAIQAITSFQNFRNDWLMLSTLFNCHFYLWEDSQAIAVLNMMDELNPNLRKAFAAFEDAIQKDRNDLDSTMLRLSDIESDMSDYRRSANQIHSLFDSILSEPGHSSRFVGDIAKVLKTRETSLLVSLGDYDSAIAACDDALHYDREAPGLLANKGAAYYLAGNYSEALIYYNFAILYELDKTKKKTYTEIKEDIFQKLTIGVSS